ncbi:transcriptional adapter 1 [Copidosoma floridanum]|uniref:transcriptional adapter 1 n=1 Tax=Copidosoma floridanum TaxID=29053 RepID=UPI0006C9B3CA|nr:transcriptional adapter 1 [Copidosoma floridanum]
MMTTIKDLNVARKALMVSLGDKSKTYFDKMRLWFQMKSTKEEFDAEARSMMTEDQVHLHNEFLLCLFNKVRGLVISAPPTRMAHKVSNGSNSNMNNSNSNSNGNNNSGSLLSKTGGCVSLKRKYKSDNANFEPADVYAEVLSQVSSPVGDEPVGANRSSAQELILPDRTFVLARLMLAAWENNMDGAEDSTAHIIIAATHIFLKNILTAMMTRRKGFQVRDGSFIYNIGEPVPSSWKRNTSVLHQEAKFANPTMVVDPVGQMPKMKMSIEEAEQATAFALGCAEQRLEPPLPPLGIVDLQKTLRKHKNLVKNHMIYATNCERLFTFNTHPTAEEVEAQKLIT